MSDSASLDTGTFDLGGLAVTAHPARMYDYWLDGKDHYAVDREAAGQVMAAFPGIRDLARANRAFLVRAVRFMAGQGVCQFLDLGTGIPTSPNVHEVARAVVPDAAVAYVDNDLVVTRHSKALRATGHGVIAVQGDVRRPREILENPEITSLIDFTRPVAVLLVSVLHFITDEDDPPAIVRAFTSRMVPGSYLALSHGTADEADPEAAAEIERAYEGSTASGVLRTAEAISGLFEGLELADPGRLVDVSQWRPDEEAVPTSVRILAGVARVP